MSPDYIIEIVFFTNNTSKLYIFKGKENRKGTEIYPKKKNTHSGNYSPSQMILYHLSSQYLN